MNRMVRPVSEPWFKAAFGPHYPLVYAHRDTAEAERCLQVLKGLVPLESARRPILDLGCGDGRHLERMRAGGLPAVGLDLSADLLAGAAERDASLPLLRGDMRQLPFSDQSLDAVLSLFTAFGYFGPLPDNEPVVAQVARVLAPGGHWLLDYFNCDRVREELASGEDFVRARSLQGVQVRETRRYHAAEGLVTKEVRLQALPGDTLSPAARALPDGGMSYTEQVAVFSLAEMDALARSRGLVRLAAAGGYEGQAIGQGERWILVYGKSRP